MRIELTTARNNADGEFAQPHAGHSVSDPDSDVKSASDAEIARANRTRTAPGDRAPLALLTPLGAEAGRDLRARVKSGLRELGFMGPGSVVLTAVEGGWAVADPCSGHVLLDLTDVARLAIDHARLAAEVKRLDQHARSLQTAVNLHEAMAAEDDATRAQPARLAGGDHA